MVHGLGQRLIVNHKFVQSFKAEHHNPWVLVDFHDCVYMPNLPITFALQLVED